ncbi:MAG: hypothetical protein ACKOAW_11535, partial [Actinomycetota bacterium]
ADWLIDMGPEGGSRGGTIVAEGTPEEVAAVEASHTGRFLACTLQVSPRTTRGATRSGQRAARRSAS